jgi:hypothetical protein
VFFFRHPGNPEMMNFIVRIGEDHRVPLMGRQLFPKR